MAFFNTLAVNIELFHIIAGCLVGFVIGLTGVGGGSLMTPILVLGFAIPPAIAVGTDLLYAAITKCSGVYFHNRHQTIDWKIVLLLASGSIPASIITIALLESFRDAGFDYEKLMTLTLSVMLILTSVVVFLKNRLLSHLHERLNKGNPIISHFLKYRSAITVQAGVMLGILVTISSVGAGAIGAALLFILYPRKPSISIVGTDIAHAVPLTAIAGLGHVHFGTVDFSLLGGLLIGGLPGIYLGSMAGKNLPDKILRPLMATLLLGLGLKFIF